MALESLEQANFTATITNPITPGIITALMSPNTIRPTPKEASNKATSTTKATMGTPQTKGFLLNEL